MLRLICMFLGCDLPIQLLQKLLSSDRFVDCFHLVQLIHVMNYKISYLNCVSWLVELCYFPVFSHLFLKHFPVISHLLSILQLFLIYFSLIFQLFLDFSLVSKVFLTCFSIVSWLFLSYVFTVLIFMPFATLIYFCWFPLI